jgi:hypothetical protein
MHLNFTAIMRKWLVSMYEGLGKDNKRRGTCATEKDSVTAATLTLLLVVSMYPNLICK